MNTCSGKLIAIIPARGGSKRVQNKNMRKLGTITLLEKTIGVALDSNIFTDVVVSTDSKMIAEHALEVGANVPFMRPDSLASDYASTDDVIKHAIGELGLSDDDLIFILQPTSPFRLPKDLVEAAKLLASENTSGVVSVCECEHSPLWANTLSSDLRMGNFISAEAATKRSQDLPKYYRLNGAVFAYQVSYFNRYGRKYSAEVKAYIMPTSRSLDIDTETDFEMALLLSENL